MTTCPHDWQRTQAVERMNGPHVFRCTWCEVYGWRPRLRRKKDVQDPIRVYESRRQILMAERQRERPPITVRPMTGRRGMNGGYVPPGSSGGRR